MWPFWWKMGEGTIQGEGDPRCDFRCTTSNGGGRGVCVRDWYTCLWGPGWGWCYLCGWLSAVVLIVLLYDYHRERRDAIRVEGVGSRRHLLRDLAGAVVRGQ